MKLEELATQVRPVQPVEGEVPPGEEEFEGDDTPEDNLTEALSQLENCAFLLSALEEIAGSRPSRFPLSKYFRKEISRVKEDTINLLLQYNIGLDDESEI